jgi:hypothetical protein
VYDLVEHDFRWECCEALRDHEEVVVSLDKIRLKYERLLVLGVDAGCHMLKVVGLMFAVYSESNL